MIDGYKIAIICGNGHLITNLSVNGDNTDKKYCRDCGAETISKCRNCGTSIKGDYISSFIISLPSEYIPSFCHNCGQPYPWTEKLLSKTKILINSDTTLSISEKNDLCESAKNIMIESKSSKVDASIFKKLTGKTGGLLKDSLYQFALDVASETAKKIIFQE